MLGALYVLLVVLVIAILDYSVVRLTRSDRLIAHKEIKRLAARLAQLAFFYYFSESIYFANYSRIILVVLPTPITLKGFRHG
jgi:hypothetical protein